MNILALGAHSDDIELGCGGSLARYASLGHNIYLYVATKSGYSDSEGNLIRSDNQSEI
jgi:LmbE family N-acetylglucosaminyl deacetylase